MNCIQCAGKCKCIDSRAVLAYGVVHKQEAKRENPVKERKYVCAECNKVFITQEFIARSYTSRSKDKRLHK